MPLPEWPNLLNRIETFDPNAKALWGKMNAAQMLAHCRIAIEAALGERHVIRKDSFISRNIIHPLVMVLPWPKGNIPTAREFRVVEENVHVRTVPEEAAGLLAKLRIFMGSTYQLKPHPMFGELSHSQWVNLQRKHLDHHLRQFGA